MCHHTCWQEDMQSAAIANVTLEPFKMSRVKRLGYIPRAVNRASANMGRISNAMCKAWNNSIWNFIFFWKYGWWYKWRDALHRSNCSHHSLSNELKKPSRPYLVSAGIENEIQYIFTMNSNPLMSEILSKAEKLILHTTR